MKCLLPGGRKKGQREIRWREGEMEEEKEVEWREKLCFMTTVSRLCKCRYIVTTQIQLTMHHDRLARMLK